MRQFLIISFLLTILFISCAPQPEYDYRIMINYELGMHCTGFDFEYCCILPPYNSIQVQVVKVGTTVKLPRLLDDFDHKDPTVLIDPDTAKRFRLKYELVDNTFSEGSKMVYWKAPFDMNLNGNPYDSGESVANGYFSHLYIYSDLEGGNPENTSLDAKKKYIGGPGMQVPQDAGPSGQKLSGYLRNSGNSGTIVYTKSPVLDNTPIVLTNPGIWEALGLPVTPFLVSEVAGHNLKKVNEKMVQPYQVARVTLVDAETDKPVLDSKGQQVYFSGTNPIDVPNCSNCHATKNVNQNHPDVFKLVNAEFEYWKNSGASDWYAHQKATSISILTLHDKKHGTGFTSRYNPAATSNRLGRGAVLCQKCHGDNVIGVLGAGKVVNKSDGKVFVEESAHTDYAIPEGTPIEFLDAKNPNTPTDGTLIPPLTEAIHNLHLRVRPMPDGKMRTGSCQGCHPAHRFDRDMEGYPITAEGENAYSGKPGSVGNDNRDARGGCYANRDVHANKNKDKDGTNTPSHLNAIGSWLKDNVAYENGNFRGLWCTNCHTGISKELYKTDRLKAGEAFHPEQGNTLRDDSLDLISSALNMSKAQLLADIDPKVEINNAGEDTGPTISGWLSAERGRTTAPIAIIATDGKNPVISNDSDRDISVDILDPNPDNQEQHKNKNGAAPPYEAATYGRDYWLSPGVPHCADCHAAPFVEGQGGVAFPINQPGKYSSMRYSKGHAGLSCQACHESIHGLYPVTPDVDQTTYAQAAQLNPDKSHGPLKCGACHKAVNQKGVPILASDIKYNGNVITGDFDLAVQWIHASAPDLGGKSPGILKNGM